MAADLHCHTLISDGSDSPEFVTMLARNIGLEALAITDHDYYSGFYNAERLGERLGIRVINGVECSCFDAQRGNKVHILCYDCKYPDAVEDILARKRRLRLEAAQLMISKVAKLYPITEEMVMDGVKGSFCGKQHIMLALMKAGFADEIFSPLFNQLFSKNGGSCYVRIEDIDMMPAMERLHEAKGVIVMAHPSVYRSIGSLPDLIKAGIHGIELNHPRNKSEDIEIIKNAAADNKLLLTGGTDFHGYFTPSAKIKPLGSFTTSHDQLAELLAKADELHS